MEDVLNLEELFKNEVFKNIEVQKIDALRQLSGKLSGKSGKEIIMTYMDFYKNLPEKQKLTQSEQSAVMEVMMNSFSKENREKFEKMSTLMKGMSK